MYVVGPIIGTISLGFLSGDPLLFLRWDLAGVPVMAYAYITIIPFAIPFSLVLGLVCYLYARKLGIKKEIRQWRSDFIKIGFLFGLLTASPVAVLASFQGEFKLLGFLAWFASGAASGVVCSLLVYKIWFKATKQMAAQG